jgi:site-specific DNA recombinase
MSDNRYFIYTRKSSEAEDRQMLSIEAQLAELNEYAAREHLHIAASFEEAKTARKPGRIVFAEMLARIEKGEANGILAWHPDRLARNSIDGGALIYLLDTGVLMDLKFPTVAFDNSPNGKFMLMIAFGQSKLYVDQLSENIKRGNRQKLRKGLWPAVAPLGYVNNSETKGIDPNPEKAAFVRKAFQLFATGEYTFRSLAREVESTGLRSYRDNVLSSSCVQRMLTNPIYYGAIRFNGEMHEGIHEPLVTKHLFDDVQAVMKSRAKKKRKRKHEFLFANTMQCASCGCAITAERQKGHVYYRCTKRRGNCDEKYLREESLLDQVKEIVKQESLPDDWAENMLGEIDKEEQQETDSHRAAVQHLLDRKSEIDQKLDKLLDLQLDGSITHDEYLVKKNTLVQEKLSINQNITDAERGECERFEPLRILILEASEAKKFLSDENVHDLPAFLRSLSSNALLQNKTVRWEAKKPWAAVVAAARCSDWRRERDSNPRDPLGAYAISSRAPSTARPSLQCVVLHDGALFGIRTQCQEADSRCYCSSNPPSVNCILALKSQ